MKAKLPCLRIALRLALASPFATLAGITHALEGGLSAPLHHFGIVGAIASSREHIGRGFSAVQVAPHWVLTAAHVAPAPGAIFANDFGVSGIAEVIPFATPGAGAPPIAGALRDDLVLVRLSRPIACQYYPMVAESDFLPKNANLPAGVVTLVANNPDLAHRRFGLADLVLLPQTPAFDLALASYQAGASAVRVVSGDSGSPMFFGRLWDTDAHAVLLGVASSRSLAPGDTGFGVYTLIGPYRGLIDQAVEASGERVHWSDEELR